MENLNAKLVALYESKWHELNESMQIIMSTNEYDIKPASPLLIQIDDEKKYIESDIKLMIFGQETNGWGDEFHSDLSLTLNLYETFVNQGECWSYGGHFWNGVSRFKLLLQERFPNKKIYFVYNNLLKIGKSERISDSNPSGTPSAYISDAEKTLFNIIPKEIQILNPDICLFLTGPRYDTMINRTFGDIIYSPIDNEIPSRRIAKVDIQNTNNAFRTYHPGYLWRNNIDHYFMSIIDKISVAGNQ